MEQYYTEAEPPHPSSGPSLEYSGHLPFFGDAPAQALVECDISLPAPEGAQGECKILYLGCDKELVQTASDIPDQPPEDDLFPFEKGHGSRRDNFLYVLLHRHLMLHFL